MQTQNTKPKRHKYLGFTLVELIVTISILTILSTISFVSIKDYYGGARDSVRITDIKSIQKGLVILQLKTGSFFLPDNALEIDASPGVVLSYQGYVGNAVSRVINTNKTPLDPKDTTRYTYTVDKAMKKAQLMGYLESGKILQITSFGRSIYDQFINQSYATASSGGIDYQNRFVYVAGDTIGVLTDANNAPLQESTTATGVSLQTMDTSGITAQFGGTAYGGGQSTGTGDILVTQMNGAITNTIPCNPTTYSGYTITALADNETKTFTKSLTIPNGVGTGSLQIQCQNGTLDTLNAIETSTVGCNVTFVNNGSNVCVQDVCGSAPTYSISNGIQKFNTPWVHNVAGGGYCTFVCQAGYYWNNTSCTQASIGYFVANSGSTSQTACSTSDTYQDTGAQTSCKTVSTGYYSTPVGGGIQTGQVQCEANFSCVNGVKTACATGYSSATGSTACTDQAPPTITSVTVTTTGNQPACNTIRFTINGATDFIGLHATPYSFDAGVTWQTPNTKDYAGTTQLITTGQIKVRDASGNIYTYGTDVTSTSTACTCNLPWGGTIANANSATAWQTPTPVYPTLCTSESRVCTNGVLAGSYTNQICTQGYIYTWVSGSPGACSLTCGGGTQSIPVTCQRNDGSTVSDTFCGGGKPATSQSCNAQACPVASCNNTTALGCTTGSTQSDGGQVSCNTTRTWYCGGAGYQTSAQCSKVNAVCPVNGVCGTANGTSVSSQPTTNLCSAGNASVVAGSGPWTWNCNGIGTGTTAACSAIPSCSCNMTYDWYYPSTTCGGGIWVADLGRSYIGMDRECRKLKQKTCAIEGSGSNKYRDYTDNGYCSTTVSCLWESQAVAGPCTNDGVSTNTACTPGTNGLKSYCSGQVSSTCVCI